MNQGMDFSGMSMDNNVAFNGVAAGSMPSTTEHRSVLVSRKFINGLVTNYNKNKDSVESYSAPAAQVEVEQPKFEAPTIEQPTFNFEQVQPAVQVAETPVSQVEEAPELPKFDFSSLVQPVQEEKSSEEEKTIQPIAVEKTGDDSDPEGTAINIANYGNIENISNEELLAKYSNIDGISTETMLFEVQNTLNSLANMVSVLTQQRTELLTQQEEIADANEALDKREEAIELKEKNVEEKEQANEAQRQEIEKLAADNAKQLSDRTLALKAKAQELEDKERAYANKVEELNKEIAKNVENAKGLKKRAEELNAKEAELDKLSIELKGRLNNLVDAENKFKVIVKEFNDTVNFNNTLNSIATPVKQLKKELNEITNEKAA